MQRIVSPAQVAASLAEFWSPRVIAEVDDSFVKVAKVRGEFVWHQHDDEDELFFILKGRLTIEIENGDPVELGEGELFVVPKEVRHRPIAKDECHILLIERKTTLHTGGEVSELTRTVEEQLLSLTSSPSDAP